MPALIRTPRERWIEQGLRVLASGGPDAIRIEPLAAALGVTKGGFYWHFRDRRDLLDAMLDRWEQTHVDRAIEVADHGGGSGRARLRRLFNAAGELDQILDVEMAVRDWARRDAAVVARVARVDERRLAYLRPLFAEFCDDPDDVEGRCLLALTLFVGQSLVVTTHGRRSRAEATTAALRHLLRRPKD